MWFKNLIVYRFDPAIQIGLEGDPAATERTGLSASSLFPYLEDLQLQPCGAVQRQSYGFVPPFGRDLIERAGTFLFLALGTEEKVLPPATVKARVAEMASEAAQIQGYPVGKRQLRALKEQATDALLAKAFTKRRVTRAWLDLDAGLLVVDATSEGRANDLVSALRDALGSFPAKHLETKHTATSAMALWATQADGGPGRFTVDSDIELQAIGKSRATVKFSRGPLDHEEIRRHIMQLKQVKRLGLSWADRIAFVLDEHLQLRKFEFIGVKAEPAETSSDANEAQVQKELAAEAELLLMCGETKALLDELIHFLGGEVQS